MKIIYIYGPSTLFYKGWETHLCPWFPMGHHQLINSSFHTIFTNHFICLYIYICQYTWCVWSECYLISAFNIYIIYIISLIHIFIGVLCINIISVLWTYIVSWGDITLRTLPDNHLEDIIINLRLFLSVTF